MVDAERLRRVLQGVADARFRNVLVHGYARVDDEQVVDRLQQLEVLDRFVAAVAAVAG